MFKECQKFKISCLMVTIIGLSILLTSCADAKKNIARGEELLAKRKYQEAVMEFRAAADIDKNSADAHWGLARAREGQGDVVETVTELQKTIELKPDHLDAKTKLGNYLLLIEPPQIQEAEKLVGEIFQQNPNFVEGHILKASLLSAQKKSDIEVLAVLNHAISLDDRRVESYLSLARFYMKTDKPAEAEATIKKAISVNDKSALGYLEYARFFSFSNHPVEAEVQFKKAVEVEPTNIETRESLANFYLGQQQFDKAEQAFKDLVEVQGNSPEGKLQLAEFYSVVGREDDAINTFNDILKGAPEFVRARYRLGEIYLERKENSKVIEQVEKLLVINDSDTQALMLRARVKMQENNADEAVKDLEAILKKQPSQKDALFYMTQARLSLGQIDEARAFISDLEKYHPKYVFSKLLKIQASFAANENQQALVESNQLLDAVNGMYPTPDINGQQLERLKVQGLSARGQAYLVLGKINESRADLQEVLKRSPSSSAANVNLARVEQASRNFAGALSYYEKAYTLDKKNFDALSGIVSVYKQQKQYAPAQDRIDKVLAEVGDQKDLASSLHYLKSDVFTAQNNLGAAESELQKSIELDSEYFPAYSAYASILIAQNQADRAIEQYKKVIEKKPSAAIYSLIGMLEDARQNVDEAEKNYREALKITPNSPIAANNLAWIIAAYDRGVMDEALTLAQTCVDKHPAIAGFHDTLGFAYYKKGLHAPAVEQFKKAVTLDETDAARSGTSANPAYRVRLAMALVSMGDKIGAKKEAETALRREKDLTQQEAQEAKKMVGN